MTRNEVIYEKRFLKREIPTEEELAKVDITSNEDVAHLTSEQIMERIYK